MSLKNSKNLNWREFSYHLITLLTCVNLFPIFPHILKILNESTFILSSIQQLNLSYIFTLR